MIQKCAHKMADFCVQNQIIEQEDTDVYIYGFEILISYIVNIATVLFLAWLFDALLYICVFLVFFYPLRIFSGGFHAEDYRKCYMISVVAILLVLFTEKYAVMFWSPIVVGLFMALSAIYIFNHAPLEDKNKPLDNSEKAKYRRKARIAIGVELITVFILLLIDHTHHVTYYAACAIFTMFVLMCVGNRKNSVYNTDK